MAGGAGADTYIVDNSNDFINETTASTGGIDLVITHTSYDLSLFATGVEKLTLTGSAIDGTGNALNNLIVGNGNDNTLDGGAGIDTLQGGLGNDTYIVDVIVASGLAKLQDVVTDTGGTDTIVLRADDLGLGHATSFTLATGIENMDASQTDSANAFNLIGNTGNNILTANDHGDTLNGMTGTDTLIGGLGNDTFIVGNTLDVVHGNGGEDVIVSSVSYDLSAASVTGVNALTLTGTTAINGTANDNGDTLTGNGGINSLTGGAGNDTLDGGLGHDILTGGAGSNTFVFTHAEAASANNSDTITDFKAGGGGDVIDISNILAGHYAGGLLGGFVHLQDDHNGGTDLLVNATGSGTTFVLLADIAGVSVNTLIDADHMVTAGNLIVTAS
jgi:Ca2+-binding RTX toxin-like protein